MVLAFSLGPIMTCISSGRDVGKAAEKICWFLVSGRTVTTYCMALGHLCLFSCLSLKHIHPHRLAIFVHLLGVYFGEF